ncbi:unnamed protein product [Sphagnum balticum]
MQSIHKSYEPQFQHSRITSNSSSSISHRLIDNNFTDSYRLVCRRVCTIRLCIHSNQILQISTFAHRSSATVIMFMPFVKGVAVAGKLAAKTGIKAGATSIRGIAVLGKFRIILQVREVQMFSVFNEMLHIPRTLTGKVAAKGTLKVGKLAGKGAITAGKLAGKGAMRVGKVTGKGAMKADKLAGKASKAVGKTGKVAGKGGRGLMNKDRRRGKGRGSKMGGRNRANVLRQDRSCLTKTCKF